jgi:Uma2 family endonuclease
MTVVIEREATTRKSGHQVPTGFEKLSRDLEQADAAMPDGYNTEIIGGKIVMTPWSQGAYNRILDSLQDQLASQVPEGHRARTTPNLYQFPQHSRSFGPDLHVADDAAIDVPTIHLPGSALALVAEQTSSSTRDTDYEEKLRVYGRSEVPVYVLIDMQEALVFVFHDPTPDLGYRQHAQVKFGESVHIPAPFDFDLDTSDWEN